MGQPPKPSISKNTWKSNSQKLSRKNDISFLPPITSQKCAIEKEGVHPPMQEELEAHLTKPHLLHTINHTQYAYLWPVASIPLPKLTQSCHPAQAATMTSAGGKHLLKKRVQNGQKELGLCKWMAKKKDSLPKQVQWMAWWFQHVSFWNHLLLYQSRGVLLEEPFPNENTRMYQTLTF